MLADIYKDDYENQFSASLLFKKVLTYSFLNEMFCFDRLLYNLTCLYNRGIDIDMDDGIEIEQASLEDVELILQLQMRAYLSEAEIYNDYSIPPLIQSFNEIKQEFSQQVFLKANTKRKRCKR